MKLSDLVPGAIYKIDCGESDPRISYFGRARFIQINLKDYICPVGEFECIDLEKPEMGYFSEEEIIEKLSDSLLNIPLYKGKCPTEPGIYIWSSRLSKVVKPEMIHVVRYPATDNFGVKLDSYLGISNFGWRNICAFEDDYFSEKLEFTKI